MFYVKSMWKYECAVNMFLVFAPFMYHITKSHLRHNKYNSCVNIYFLSLEPQLSCLSEKSLSSAEEFLQELIRSTGANSVHYIKHNERS